MALSCALNHTFHHALKDGPEMNLASRLYQRLQPHLLWPPIVALPIILNLRWNGFIAPNEEPKWAVLVLLGLWLSVAAFVAALIPRGSRSPHVTSAPPARFNAPAVGLFIFWLGLALGTTYAVNPGEALNRLAFWTFAMVTLLATARAVRLDPRHIQKLKTSITLSTLLLCLFFWHGFFFDFKRPGFDPFVQFSRIGHFNFTADALMFLIPLNLWIALTPGHPLLRLTAALSTASSGAMLIISGSIGGMGGLIAGAALTLTIALLKNASRTRALSTPSSTLRWVGAGLVLLAILAAKPILEHMPQEYRNQMFLRAEWGNPPTANALESATSPPPLAPLWIRLLPLLGARTPMWASTTGMIADHPLKGLGTGSFLFEYPAYSKRYDLFADFETLGMKVKTNPHNVLLQIGADNGLPMMLLFLGLYLWLLLKVLMEAIREPSAFWLCGTWALTAAGLDALVNHVFFNPASLFLAAMTIGLYYGRLQGQGEKAKFTLPPWLGSIAAPLLGLVGVLWLAIFPIRWLISEAYVAEAVRLQSQDPPASQRQILTTWVAARTFSPTNVLALYGLAQLAISQDNLSVAERYLLAFLKLAPNHTPALNLLATIESKTNRREAAEKTLEKALKLEPDAEVMRENLESLRHSKPASEGG